MIIIEAPWRSGIATQLLSVIELEALCAELTCVLPYPDTKCAAREEYPWQNTHRWQESQSNAGPASAQLHDYRGGQ